MVNELFQHRIRTFVRQVWVKAAAPLRHAIVRVRADDGVTGHPVLALFPGPVHLRRYQWRGHLHHLHIDGTLMVLQAPSHSLRDHA